MAWLLTRRAPSDSVESLASTLVDSQIDLNPHQVDAALFACQNPLSRGVILADEVGLGKTIEAGLVISQRWAERRRRILIIVPANLRKQWHQELQDKFNLHGLILEAKNYNALRKQDKANPFVLAGAALTGPVICSYQFAKAKADDIKAVDWDLVVLDEAHRLRNVYKTSNVIAKTLKDALAHLHSKVLLTATALQNSLLELYGLVSMIDDRVFGDVDSFRAQFTSQPKERAFANLRLRIAPICKRTLRRQVQPYVPYTARRAIVQEFTPSDQERELSALVGDYLRRPNLNALPDGQRQLISLVLWKLLASSSHAIAGALETMAKRLQGVLDEPGPAADLTEALDEDYEALDETAEEHEGNGKDATDPSRDARGGRDAVAAEIAELRRFNALATSIRDDAKGCALLTALTRAFAELERLGAEKKAIIFTESRRTQDYLLTLLAETPYGAGIVLFNGTNSDARTLQVHPMRGALFENMLVVEYRKHCQQQGLANGLYFWRDNIGNEVDLLIERAGELWPIEMKSGATFQGEWLRALSTWQRHAAAARQGIPMLISAAPGSGMHQGMMLAEWRDALAMLAPAGAMR